MKRALLASALAVAAALPGASALAQPDKVTVAYFLEWPTANQVAQANDTYSEELGVPVEWRAFANGNEMSQAMASGDVDIAYSQGLVPWVVAVSNGLPLKLVGIAVSYAEADNCVVHEDTGITKENAKELEGKTVATPIGNVTHYKLLRMLDHLGVDADKVNLVQMNGADAAVALSRGDVAMACAFGGPVQRMLEHGDVLMTAEEQEEIGIRVFDVVSTTESFAENNPELLREFMRVTAEANERYRENPDEYVDTISQAAGMDRANTEEMLGMFTFPSVEEQKSEKWMGGGVQEFTSEVAEFFEEQGQIDKALESYDFAIDASFL